VQTRVLCASSASRRSFSKHTIGNENKKKRKVKKKSLKVAIHPIFFFFFKYFVGEKSWKGKRKNSKGRTIVFSTFILAFYLLLFSARERDERSLKVI
jgi:hypothetical protein